MDETQYKIYWKCFVDGKCRRCLWQTEKKKFLWIMVVRVLFPSYLAYFFPINLDMK